MSASAHDRSLCGVSGASTSDVYFAVAVRPDASILRADDAETVIETHAPPGLWIFVARPVDAVLCRVGDPPRVETRCAGPEAACAVIVKRLTADPRAHP